MKSSLYSTILFFFFHFTILAQELPKTANEEVNQVLIQYDAYHGLLKQAIVDKNISKVNELYDRISNWSTTLYKSGIMLEKLNEADMIIVSQYFDIKSLQLEALMSESFALNEERNIIPNDGEKIPSYNEKHHTTSHFAIDNLSPSELFYAKLPTSCIERSFPIFKSENMTNLIYKIWAQTCDLHIYEFDKSKVNYSSTLNNLKKLWYNLILSISYLSKKEQKKLQLFMKKL